MESIATAHQAHLQALLTLYNLKQLELHIYELIEQKDYDAIVKKKKHYHKIVEKLTELVQHLRKNYNAMTEEEKFGEEGQTLKRLFINLKYFDEALMP